MIDTRQYYTVVVREGQNRDWFRTIGSWYQSECESELQHWLDDGWQESNLKIITTRGNNLRSIITQVHELNMKEGM